MTTTKNITNGKLIYSFEDGIEGPYVQVEVYTHLTKNMALDETCADFDWFADANDIASWLMSRGVTTAETIAFLGDIEDTFEDMGYTFLNDCDEAVIDSDVQTVIDVTTKQLDLSDYGIRTLYDYFRLYNDDEELDTQDIRSLLGSAVAYLKLGIERHPVYDEIKLIDDYTDTMDYCIEEGIDVTDSAAFCHELRVTSTI